MSARPHESSHLHVSGKSEFVDDRPSAHREVFIEVVYSDIAHGKIKKIETKKAKQIAGVHAVFTAKDLPGNIWGTIFKDQPVLADEVVNYNGEAIAIVAAATREIARVARLAVKVEFERLPAILNIAEAKKQKSFIGSARKIERGKIEEAFAASPRKLVGQITIRGADHFYLESQVSLAYPKEDGQIEVHTSSQHPTEVQHVVAHTLGIAQHKVVVVVKRMGGAFGGKESQAAPFAAYAAFVAQKLQRPARILLTKDDDMVTTGKRNPFENNYRVGFDDRGRILSLDVDLFSDGGAYADLSTSIMERAMLHIDNAYYIPNLRVRGQVCRTHFHPHTAFRGFGGPKGVATIEKIIEEIALELKMDPLDVRKANLYGDEGSRNTTHYGQIVENNVLSEIFARLEKTSEYSVRRKEIDEWNHANRFDGYPRKLRGLSLTPVKFGISFTTRFLNQANALVIVHRDGTIQLSTGATEMGQGVHARISELVASEFGVDRDLIQVMPTSTDKNANTSPTAASSGTDLNGAAALMSARKIKYRLSELALRLFKIPEERWAKNTAGLGTESEISPTSQLDLKVDDPNFGADWATGRAEYLNIVFDIGEVFHKEKPNEKISFGALVNEAYYNRISLTEYSFYKFPGIAFDKLKGEGRAFLYFTQGAAVSEVSLNPDTGEVKVDRVDILMDLGRPVNEALDMGQVTGGFIQGMGWVTTEKLYYDQEGFLRSHSPSTYKIPNVQDTPRIFNAHLLPNERNFRNVRGTKAAGEPPLLAAISVWTAVLNAVSYKTNHIPQMELPATQEQVLRSLHAEKFAKLEKSSE